MSIYLCIWIFLLSLHPNCDTMTKDELILRLKDIEWDDFEVKEAQNKLPDNVWETVSAFSNTSGGWIVFGVKQSGKRFDVQGV